MRKTLLSLVAAAAAVVSFPALAASFCGTMAIPAVELNYMSRGFHGGHQGVDLMAAMGSPIRAAAGGTVVYAGWYYAYGNIVDIRHSDNVITRYAHMQAFVPGLAVGTTVAPGEIIGKVGATGRAHGAHVHFEVRVNGRAVDPKPYIAMAPCPEDRGGSDQILEAMAPDLTPRAKKKKR